MRRAARGSSLPVHPAQRAGGAVHHRLVDRRRPRPRKSPVQSTHDRSHHLLDSRGKPMPSTSRRGYLVYAVAGTLRAVRFDPVTLAVIERPGYRHRVGDDAWLVRGRRVQRLADRRARVWPGRGGRQPAVAGVGHTARPGGAPGGRAARAYLSRASRPTARGWRSTSAIGATGPLDLGSRASDADAADRWRLPSIGSQCGCRMAGVIFSHQGARAPSTSSGKRPTHGDRQAVDHESEPSNFR